VNHCFGGNISFSKTEDLMVRDALKAKKKELEEELRQLINATEDLQRAPSAKLLCLQVTLPSRLGIVRWAVVCHFLRTLPSSSWALLTEVM
jgi:hypothetical protein